MELHFADRLAAVAGHVRAAGFNIANGIKERAERRVGSVDDRGEKHGRQQNKPEEFPA